MTIGGDQFRFIRRPAASTIMFQMARALKPTLTLPSITKVGMLPRGLIRRRARLPALLRVMSISVCEMRLERSHRRAVRQAGHQSAT